MNWTREYLRPSTGGERLRERRLADAGDVLDQQVAARDQAGERQLDRVVLADDDARELALDGLDALGERDGLGGGTDGHGRVREAEVRHSGPAPPGRHRR